MFRSILVAIDGSDYAARALLKAADLAQSGNARMTVMTSVPDPSTWLVSRVALAGGIDFEQLARESERESNDLLEDAVAELPDSLPVTRLLKHGRPGERILEQVSDGGHDLVVMASSGRGEVRSLVPAASATWC